MMVSLVRTLEKRLTPPPKNRRIQILCGYRFPSQGFGSNGNDFLQASCEAKIKERFYLEDIEIDS